MLADLLWWIYTYKFAHPGNKMVCTAINHNKMNLEIKLKQGWQHPFEKKNER